VKIQINYFAIVFVVVWHSLCSYVGLCCVFTFSLHEWRDDNQHKASWLRVYPVEEFESSLLINGEIEKSVECQCSDDWNLTDATNVIQISAKPWEKVIASEEYHKNVYISSSFMLFF